MPVSRASTLPNSSPVARRSVGFWDGVRTRCKPSAARAARGAPATSASAESARNPRVRAIIGGEWTIAAEALGGLRPPFLWLLIVVAAGAGGVHLARRVGLAPGPAPPRGAAGRAAPSP